MRFISKKKGDNVEEEITNMKIGDAPVFDEESQFKICRVPNGFLYYNDYVGVCFVPEADKKRIVMIGNNLKKDIAGANRQGLISVWLDWSPRYFHTVEEPDWQPDYTVHTPQELLPLLHKLNEELKSDYIDLENASIEFAYDCETKQVVFSVTAPFRTSETLKTEN